MQRRKFLKATGGIGAIAASGTGLALISNSAAAATVSISATNPATIANDRGDVSEVTADPQFSVTWENLDDAVGKVFFLVEGKVGGGNWSPIFRATPWLTESRNNSYVREEPGTTGQYTVKQPLSVAYSQDERFSDGSEPNYSMSPLVVADEQGRPDYSSIDFTSIDGVDLNSFLNGTSIGSAADYPGAHQDGGHQNNYWDIDAGYYGAADGTSALDNPNDGGSNKATDVKLRYTFELQRPNLSQLKYHPAIGGSYDGSTTSEQIAEAAEAIDWIEESDIDEGNSKIVMNGEDGNTNFSNPSGIPYDNLQANDGNHVGILENTATFTVTAKNEASDSGVTGSSNTNAS
ncbi:hypothetical protein HSR121_0955 [Halapricum desulfuricans]|uniref:Uncharacterized protein n=2 Tax=Halapricum desulfuricans TaxID=2841257 RepID=A0A897N1W4_9EURY|nr:hypothetical protein HSR121_0955 [Halapricum desulfuricans]